MYFAPPAFYDRRRASGPEWGGGVFSYIQFSSLGRLRKGGIVLVRVTLRAHLFYSRDITFSRLAIFHIWVNFYFFKTSDTAPPSAASCLVYLALKKIKIPSKSENPRRLYTRTVFTRSKLRAHVFYSRDIAYSRLAIFHIWVN